MTAPDDPLAILDRITARNPTDTDLEKIRRLLIPSTGQNVGTAQNVVQLGKYDVNLGQGQDIHVGDRIYHGMDAEKIREIVRSILQELRESQPNQTNRDTINTHLHDLNVERYRKAAGSLIYESYRRHRNISPDCTRNLETLRKNTHLSQEQTKTINDEILQQCDKEYQRLEEYGKEAEQVIRNKPRLSNDVKAALKDKRIAYGIDERAEAQFINDMGYQFIKEGKYEWAEACFAEAINILKNIHVKINPNIYANQALIRIKQGKQNEALKLLLEAQKLYEEQEFPDREIDTVRNTIEEIKKARAKNSFFSRLF